jgi:hypothetical protein
MHLRYPGILQHGHELGVSLLILCVVVSLGVITAAAEQPAAETPQGTTDASAYRTEPCADSCSSPCPT